MLTPLINGSVFLFLFILFGPGIFALGYWSLRSRDKDDKRLGAKALLAYLEALTTQAALASAAFLLWVVLEYWAGRFDAPPEGKAPSNNWKGAFGTLLLHSILSVAFARILARIEQSERPMAQRFFRGLRVQHRVEGKRHPDEPGVAISPNRDHQNDRKHHDQQQAAQKPTHTPHSRLSAYRKLADCAPPVTS